MTFLDENGPPQAPPFPDVSADLSAEQAAKDAQAFIDAVPASAPVVPVESEPLAPLPVVDTESPLVDFTKIPTAALPDQQTEATGAGFVPDAPLTDFELGEVSLPLTPDSFEPLIIGGSSPLRQGALDVDKGLAPPIEQATQLDARPADQPITDEPVADPVVQAAPIDPVEVETLPAAAPVEDIKVEALSPLDPAKLPTQGIEVGDAYQIPGTKIRYAGAVAFDYGRNQSKNKPVQGIVIHHTRPGGLNALVKAGKRRDQSRGGTFGYSFYIGPKGEIVQAAPLSRRTNHIKGPTRAERTGVASHLSNANAIGISLVGAAKIRNGKEVEEPTAAQLEAVQKLTSALVGTLGITPDNIYGHGDLQTDRQGFGIEGNKVAALLKRSVESRLNTPSVQFANFVMPKDAPRGIRNHNPGNIEANGRFGGIVGHDGRFSKFATPVLGVRAMAVLLDTYQNKHGLRTVRQMINRWAPPSENKTKNYVNRVAKAMGISPDQQFNFKAKPELAERMVTAMIKHENGVQPYDRAIITEGLRAASLKAPSTPTPGLYLDGPPGGPVFTFDTSRGPATSFLRNLVSAYRTTTLSDLSISGELALGESMKERFDTIERITGQPARVALLPFMSAPIDPTHPNTPRIEVERAIDSFRATLPGPQQREVVTGIGVDINAAQRTVDRFSENLTIASRATTGGAVGQFVGSLGAFLQDPFVQLTLPFGAGAGGIGRAAVTESLLAAATEVPIQAIVQQRREDLGLPSGLGQALTNIFSAGIGAGALVAGVRGIGPLASLTKKQLLGLHDAVFRERGELDEASRALLAREVDIEDANPFSASPANEAVHSERLAEATEGVISGTRKPLETETPDRKPVENVVPVFRGEASQIGQVHSFNADDILVDADAYQFKSGADASGVSERLQGVKRWDPVSAGLVVIHERADGSRFIADGHQRLGLAKRLARETRQEIALNGYLLRESDGVTIDQARVIAAVKNIGEGTGDEFSAARIVRARQELFDALPPNSALVRDARGLSQLSDEAFDIAAKTDAISASQAAVVGRLIPGSPELHTDALKTLINVKPQNLIEAESVVRDIAASPTVKATQTDLFGTKETTEVLFKERAQILSGAVRRLKRDKSAFSLLVREEGRITETGNVLNRSANEARAQTDAEIIQNIQKLARRRGPIADALADASKKLRDGARIDRAVTGFIDDTQRALARSGDAGPVPGERGRAAEAAGERSETPDLAEVRDIPGEESLTQPMSRGDPVKAVERFDNPSSKEFQQDAQSLAADLRSDIEANGDFELALPRLADDGESIEAEAIKASELLDDVARDSEFEEQLGLCIK